MVVFLHFSGFTAYRPKCWWRFVVVCGGMWSFAVVCLLVVPVGVHGRIMVVV